MRGFLILSLVLPALLSCKRPTKPDADAGAATTPAAVSSAPSTETAPLLAMPARADFPAATGENVPVVLEGEYGALAERARGEQDQTACTDPVTLAHPLHVTDSKGKTAVDGRGVGVHLMIGNASRVCLWSWKGFEPGRQVMMPWQSHVVLRGTPTTPMIASHPRSLLVFDTEVVSAMPSPTPAPAGALPEGDSVVFVRSADAATRTVGLDLAFLYYGEAARALAAQRKETLPANQSWYLVNDSSQIRSVVLPKEVTPQYLGDKPGDGWHMLSLAEVAKSPNNDQPFIAVVEKGTIKSLQRISFR